MIPGQSYDNQWEETRVTITIGKKMKHMHTDTNKNKHTSDAVNFWGNFFAVDESRHWGRKLIHTPGREIICR